MGCSDLKLQGTGQGQGEQSEGRPALGWRGREGEREGVQSLAFRVVRAELELPCVL